MTKLISIANDFSRYPAGRTDHDSPVSGQKFRTAVLLPKLRDADENNDCVVVSLDGVRSYGSSFLEEAFGGLVRKEGYSKLKLKKILFIEYNDEAYAPYKDLIERYIERAHPE